MYGYTQDIRAVVIGATGGLRSSFVEELREAEQCTVALGERSKSDSRRADLKIDPRRGRHHQRGDHSSADSTD